MLTVGWCEIGSLSELGVSELPIKIDTGAQTSSLHALNIKAFERDNQKWVRFETINNDEQAITIEAPVFDQRDITSSNGQTQTRYVIKSTLLMGEISWPIEITLADRSNMKFKMLLGRQAMDNIQVIPSKKYLL